MTLNQVSIIRHRIVSFVTNICCISQKFGGLCLYWPKFKIEVQFSGRGEAKTNT